MGLSGCISDHDAQQLDPVYHGLLDLAVNLVTRWTSSKMAFWAWKRIPKKKCNRNPAMRYPQRASVIEESDGSLGEHTTYVPSVIWSLRCSSSAVLVTPRQSDWGRVASRIQGSQRGSARTRPVVPQKQHFHAQLFPKIGDQLLSRIGHRAVVPGRQVLFPRRHQNKSR